FLLAVTSVAIIVWFRTNQLQRGIWTRVIAPSIATIGLTAVFIMILVNFDLMIEAEEGSALIYIMPGLIILSGVVGLIWGEVIQRRRPQDYDVMRDQDMLSDEEEVALAQGALDDNERSTN